MSHEDEIREALKAHPISKLVAERAAKDPEYAEYIRQTRAAMRPILADLATIGFTVEWLSELTQRASWTDAIPVLLHWLPLIHHRNIELNLIRCLSVRETGNRATAFLVEAFKRTAENDPEYAWTVGNALSIVDVNGFENEIIKLCGNPNYGTARQMIVMNLHRLRLIPEAEEAALDLLEQEDVKLHAIIALGKMKSRRALFHLERLLADKRAHIRKEARKAITKIMR